MSDGISRRDMNRLQQAEMLASKAEKRAQVQAMRREAAAARAAEQSRRMHENVKRCSWILDLKEAPVFRPSLEEFADPLAYIRSIRDRAAPYGICKVIPPCTATTNCLNAMRGSAPAGGSNGYKIPTRQQVVRNIPWDNFSRTRFWTGVPKTLAKFQAMADSLAQKTFKTSMQMPAHLVELEFWRQMTLDMTSKPDDLTVEYGDNVEGTGFAMDVADPLGSSDWNLNVLPIVEASMLRLLKGSIPGVTTPMLYIGMLFSTFCWHVEDLYLYSINYHHVGAPKTWYSVAAEHADAFEAVAKSTVYAKAVAALEAQGASGEDVHREALKALLQKTTMFSPECLVAAGVPVTRTHQAAGEFVVTFPRAYHGGFSHGQNVGEAVNFAMRDWFEFGADCSMRLRFFKQVPAVPLEQLACHEMLCLSTSLRDKAAAASANGEAGSAGAGFGQWLLTAGPSLLHEGDVPLVVTFCRLVRWYHRRLSALLAAGATAMPQAFENSIPCSHCKDMAYLAVVMPDGATEPASVWSWAAAGAGPSPERLGECTVITHAKLPMFVEIAEQFCNLCRQQGWGSVTPDAWRKQGLTDRLCLPGSHADCAWEDLLQEYDWACGGEASPLSSTQSTTEALAAAAPGETADILAGLLPPEAREGAVAAPVPPPKRAPARTSGKRALSTCWAPSGDNTGTLPSSSAGKQVSSSAMEANRTALRASLAEAEAPARADTATTDPAAQHDEPVRKRSSRVSAVNAMAAWKQNIATFAEEEDSPSESGSRSGKRRRKGPDARIKREEAVSSLVTGGAPGFGGKGAQLAKLYDDGTANGARAEAAGGMHLGRSFAGGTGYGQPPAARSTQGGGAPQTRTSGGMNSMEQWKTHAATLNKCWLQKLEASVHVNQDIQGLLRYFMMLPPVNTVYPVQPQAVAAGPAFGQPATSGDGQSALLQPAGSLASMGSMQELMARTQSLAHRGSAHDRSFSGGAGFDSGHLPSLPAREHSYAAGAMSNGNGGTDSLHNGPVSAQDLSMTVRTRANSGSAPDDSLPAGKPRAGAARGRGRGRPPSASRGAAKASSSQGGSDFLPSMLAPAPHGVAAQGLSHTVNPRPLSPHTPGSLGTAGSLRDILDIPDNQVTGELHDFMNFLGGDDGLAGLDGDLL